MRFCRVVSVLLGSVLVTAGALKAYQLATEPVAAVGFFGSRWLVIGLVEFELGLGLWLIAGLYARALRVVALGSFACFAVVALARMLAGERSCACFGSVEVSPYLALAFDAAAVAASTCVPSAWASSRPWSSSSTADAGRLRGPRRRRTRLVCR